MSRGYLFDCLTNGVWLNTNRYAKHQNDSVVVRDKKNLIERYGLLGLVSVAEKLGVTVEDSWTSDEVSDAVWLKFKEITSEQIRDERRAKREAYYKIPREGGADSDRTSRARRQRWPRTYRVCFEAISEELRPTRQSRLTLQAATIVDRLRSQPVELLTEVEMRAFVEKLAEDKVLTGKGGTPLKQPAWKVFSYYENLLDRMGLVERQINREYVTCE